MGSYKSPSAFVNASVGASYGKPASGTFGRSFDRGPRKDPADNAAATTNPVDVRRPIETSSEQAGVGLGYSPEDNLSRYLYRIREYPMLKPGEEFDLARRWQNDADDSAVERMVTSHLRLVAKIAMGYRGYGLPVGELISEGNVGMMQAVKRFDPERGFRLATYAMWWIRAAIQEYILRSWSLVKIGTTAAQKKLFFNLRKIKAQMQAIDDGDLHPEKVTAIAERLDVSETEVVSMNRRMSGVDQSLNSPLRDDAEGEWQDWLVEEGDDQEALLADHQELSERRGMLSDALSTLSDRERHIISERRLKDTPATLQDLSQEYGISRERVRQIEVRAFQKLQKSVKNAVIEQHISH